MILTSDAGFVRPCPRSWQELPSTPNTRRRLARSKYLRGTLLRRCHYDGSWHILTDVERWALAKNG